MTCSDEELMRLALEQARTAPEHGDVPVGALVVVEGSVVSAAHNERELTGDPTAHAEIAVLRRACQKLGTWRLEGATLYSTVEPCPMCAGAALAARVARVVYGAPDPTGGAALSLYNIVQDPRLHHRCELTAGILRQQCAHEIEQFFRARRRPARFL
ncbi:MAG: tRNA adenosine(34) deaminase TadA [Actinomycetota bacterium]